MKRTIENYCYEKENSVKEFYLNPAQFEKWKHQNAADYTDDYFPGCLLDNFVLSCRRGYAFLYEHYVNSNMSNYHVKFLPYKAPQKEYNSLFVEFWQFEKECEELEA